MYITRKTAVSLFVGLAAVVMIGLTAGKEGLRHASRSAEVPPVDCNVGGPSYPVFCAAVGLFNEETRSFGPLMFGAVGDLAICAQCDDREGPRAGRSNEVPLPLLARFFRAGDLPARKLSGG